MKEQSVSSLKKAPLFIFAFLIFMLGQMAVFSYQDSNEVVVFRARVSGSFPEKTYHRVNLGNNNFVTGLDGEVFWTPDSFKDAFILTTIVNGTGTFSLFDIIYLFILNCILWWMLYDIKPENFFSSKILWGIRLFGFMINFYLAKELLQYYFSNYFLNNITKGQFTAIAPAFNMMPIYIGLFIQLLPYFIVKGQKMQQDQNLTI